jgi:hypothetical protein
MESGIEVKMMRLSKSVTTSRFAGAGLVLMVCASLAIAGDFEDGMKFVLSKDYARAVKSFRKAANEGNPDAQFNLGVLYSRGHGVPQDHEQAAKWYRKAAEQGDAPAQSMLGYMYLKGQGVPQDYQQAMFWYFRAADSGYAVAQYNLGVMYAKGHGLEKDYRKSHYHNQKDQ